VLCPPSKRSRRRQPGAVRSTPQTNRLGIPPTTVRWELPALSPVRHNSWDVRRELLFADLGQHLDRPNEFGGALLQPGGALHPDQPRACPNPDNSLQQRPAYPAGLLWPFRSKGNPKVLKCPTGIDPATGQTFPVSYGMNYVNGGPETGSVAGVDRGTGISTCLLSGPRQDARLRRFQPLGHAATPARPPGRTPTPPTRTHYPDHRHHERLHGLYATGMSQPDPERP